MAHSYITTGDDHAREIIGIARNVAGDIRDARVMVDMTRTRAWCSPTEWATLRNAWTVIEATRPVRRGIK